MSGGQDRSVDANAKNSIEARLERLEVENSRLGKQLRRTRRIASILAVGCVIFVGAGALQDPGPVNASQLNIIGPNGKTRVILGVTEQGAAEMDFFDADGDPHFKMGTDGKGASSFLLMRDVKDAVRIEFGIKSENNSAGLIIDGQLK